MWYVNAQDILKQKFSVTFNRLYNTALFYKSVQDVDLPYHCFINQWTGAVKLHTICCSNNDSSKYQ